MSVHPHILASTKSLSDFDLIWYVGRPRPDMRTSVLAVWRQHAHWSTRSGQPGWVSDTAINTATTQYPVIPAISRLHSLPTSCSLPLHSPLNYIMQQWFTCPNHTLLISYYVTMILSGATLLRPPIHQIYGALCQGPDASTVTFNVKTGNTRHDSIWFQSIMHS